MVTGGEMGEDMAPEDMAPDRVVLASAGAGAAPDLSVPGDEPEATLRAALLVQYISLGVVGKPRLIEKARRSIHFSFLPGAWK